MLIADCTNSIIGCISPPPGVKALPNADAGGVMKLGPIIALLNIVFNLIFIVAGLYAFFQLIAAGVGFINAGGDSKAVQAAWNKIQMTFIGIIIVVASFLIAAIMGQLIFGKPTYFLRPTLNLGK